MTFVGTNLLQQRKENTVLKMPDPHFCHASSCFRTYVPSVSTKLAEKPLRKRILRTAKNAAADFGRYTAKTTCLVMGGYL
jgi:hypothetical protein